MRTEGKMKEKKLFGRKRKRYKISDALMDALRERKKKEE